MSAVNHTPGEWRISTIGLHEPERFIILSGDVEVAIVEPRRFTNEENEANARLIAAAPALLEALQAVINGLPSRESSARGHSPGSFHFVGYLGPKKLDMIEAAITKALLTVPMPPACQDQVFNAEGHQ